MVNQLGQINALQKNFEKPINLTIKGVGNRLKQILDKREASKWIMTIEEGEFLIDQDKSKLVYLSGDADEDMEEFNPE